MSVHLNKLSSLYGCDVFLSEKEDRVINLSSYCLTRNENDLLNKGLGFSIIAKKNPIVLKIGLEKMFFELKSYERQKLVNVSEEDELKIKLQNFAIKNTPDKSKNNLSNKEISAIKSLKRNPDIIIQRPDRGSGVVVLDSAYYDFVLLELISNPDKFQKCESTQTGNIKKKINDIVRPLKHTNQQLYKAIAASQ